MIHTSHNYDAAVAIVIIGAILVLAVAGTVAIVKIGASDNNRPTRVVTVKHASPPSFGGVPNRTGQ